MVGNKLSPGSCKTIAFLEIRFAQPGFSLKARVFHWYLDVQ